MHALCGLFLFHVGPAAVPHRVQHRVQGPHQHGSHHQVRYRYQTQLPYTIIFASVQCCGSGIRCFFLYSGIQYLFYPWIRDPGWVKKNKIPILGLRNNFWVKILKFFDALYGSGIRNFFDLGSWIRDGKIRIRDPG
jgi:hypothetical protein